MSVIYTPRMGIKKGKIL